MNIIFAYFKTGAVQIAALVYFLVAGALTQVPLFNYLGYEFSAMIALVASLISGFLTIHFLTDHLTKPLTRRTWLFVISDYIGINFLLLLIPFIVITCNALVIKNCAYAQGLGYYVLLPICSMIFSISLASLIRLLFRSARFVFVVSIALILLHIAYIGYTQPQLFAYNLVLGYFPGITYDETLKDFSTLVLFREFTIVVSLLLFTLFFIGLKEYRTKQTLSERLKIFLLINKYDRTLWIVIGICITVLSIGCFYQDKMGFEYSESDIQRELGRRTESDHFILFYSEKDFSSKQIQVLRLEAEFHYSVLVDRLKTKSNKEKIEVYIYPNSETKQRFIGTSNTNIAKPWRKEIHLTTDSFGSTFRHELVHVLASEFGSPIIHASIYMAMNEGLAVAMDWQESLFSPHQYAAALLRDKKIHNTASLFTLSGFARMPSSYSYLVAGSFCKYLIERFGIERLKAAFTTVGFVVVYGETLDSLIFDWILYLKTVDITDLSPETIRVLFSQQTIFQKICARELAERNVQGVHALRAKKYEEAEKIFTLSYADAQTGSSLRGLMQSLLAQGKFSEVLQLYDELPEKSFLKIHPAVLLFTADAYYLKKDYLSARKLYHMLEEMHISESYTEVSALRGMFVDERLPDTLFQRIFYLASDDSTRLTLLSLTNTTAVSLQYLTASSLSRMKKTDSALVLFEKILHSTEEPSIKYFAAHRAASLLYDERQYERAKSFYWIAKNYSITKEQLASIDEELELCDFIQLHIN